MIIVTNIATAERVCISIGCTNTLEPHNALSCDDCVHRAEVITDNEIDDDDWLDDLERELDGNRIEDEDPEIMYNDMPPMFDRED